MLEKGLQPNHYPPGPGNGIGLKYSCDLGRLARLDKTIFDTTQVTQERKIPGRRITLHQTILQTQNESTGLGRLGRLGRVGEDQLRWAPDLSKTFSDLYTLED